MSDDWVDVDMEWWEFKRRKLGEPGMLLETDEGLVVLGLNGEPANGVRLDESHMVLRYKPARPSATEYP
jgi:hypothetical protein